MFTSQALSTETVKATTKKCHLSKLYDREITLTFLIVIVAFYLVATANLGFFKQVLSVYPFGANVGFIISVTGLLFGLMWLLLQLLCYRPLAKPVLIILILIAAVCGYFTDTYGTVFDRNMLINTLQTDQAEAMGLMSLRFFMRVFVLGLLPAFFVSQLHIKRLTWRHTIAQRVMTLLLSVALLGLCLVPFGDQYATFFRQHKIVRSYANPITPIYSVIKLGSDYLNEWQRPDTLIPHAADARRTTAVTGTKKPKLMVFVVGETARADHSSLNGYERDTMPQLAAQPNVYSFKKATSCGTSTAYSVPCMFSYASREDYDANSAQYHENVLDTLSKQGVTVIWRDNNSSSKGVADRVTFEDYKTPILNPNCDSECRDIGMLDGFDKLIQTNERSTKASKDTLILLHQMGNHGPAYYKRYPKAFEVYTPVCMTNELSKCDTSSVINGYDNAIRYTDYFLNQVIETLKPYEQRYDVVMVYVSDHGESLGENNIYLHGLPYRIAPNAQKQVPVIVWSPTDNGIDESSLTRMVAQPVSHDFITPTLLHFFGITTHETTGAPTFFKTAP